MKRCIILILTIAITIPLCASLKYDFTCYSTVGNSVMGVADGKLGIDITGYGFVGGSGRGVYIRMGMQTPFDAILELLDRVRKKVLDTMELYSERQTAFVDRAYSFFGERFRDFMPDDSTDENKALPFLPGAGGSTLGDSGLTSRLPFLQSGGNTMEADADEGGKEFFPSGGYVEGATAPEGGGEEGDAEKRNPEFLSQWRILTTLGPAYRSVMDENAMMYLGLGLSGELGYRSDVEIESKDTVVSLNAVLGGEADFGFRYFVSQRSTVRLGVHFSTSFIGISQTIWKDKEGPYRYVTKYYGYALTGRGIFETFHGQGYLMMATAFAGKRKQRLSYSNTTAIIGGGTLVPME